MTRRIFVGAATALTLSLDFRRADAFANMRKQSSTGTWSVLNPGDVSNPQPYEAESASGIQMGLHAILLRTGQVLLIGHAGSHIRSGSTIVDDLISIPKACVFDPKITPTTSNIVQVPPATHAFCGHQATLPDGRIIVAGGAEFGELADPAPALSAIRTFTPLGRGGSWATEQTMLSPRKRYYPTCVTLGDGTVVMLSGVRQWDYPTANGSNLETSIESAPPAAALPSAANSVLTSFLQEANRYGAYPVVFLLPSGSLFVHAGNKSAFVRVDNWTKEYEVSTGESIPRLWPGQGGSVLLPLQPPFYKATVMLMGGAGAVNTEGTGGSFVQVPASVTARNTCISIDTSVGTPTWTSAASLVQPRVLGDAVLLPDGNVLLVNGGTNGSSHTCDSPRRVAELYNPTTNSWTALAEATVPRLYHSTAILLPDATVLTAGHDQVNPAPSGNFAGFQYPEYRVEIFTPPYLADPVGRPVISDADTDIVYGNIFDVFTSSPSTISSACLIRPGSTTHQVNTDQRHVGLPIVEVLSDRIRLQSPPHPNVAPPGYYMLFLMGTNGKPSVAKFVNLYPPAYLSSFQWQGNSSALGHQLGRTETDGSWSANIAQDLPGMRFLSYGPYTNTLGTGTFTAVFRLLIDNNSADNDSVVTIDVVSQYGSNVRASRTITRKEFSASWRWQEFFLPFVLSSSSDTSNVEFRVLWHGKAYIALKDIRIGARWRWNAAALSSLVGGTETDGSRFADNANSTHTALAPSYIMYGPYVPLEAGSYTAAFPMKVAAITSSNDIIARIDVCINGGSTILSSQDLRSKDFVNANTWEDFVLPFTLTTAQGGSQVECRVLWFGNSKVWVRRLVIR